MANYWPGIGYITPRRTITTIIRTPSIPSTSSTTGRPSMAPLGFLLSPLTIPSATPRRSSSSETNTSSATNNKKLTTNAATTSGSCSNKKKLSTNTATTTTSKKGGHFSISDRRDLPRKALANSLHQIGPKEAHLATQLLYRGHHPHHATTGGARPSRLSIMAAAAD